MNPILPANPKASYLAYRAEIDAAIERVLDSGWYVLGEEVAAFEREFAAWNNNTTAIGVANGTDALELGLRACGVQSGDGVITVSNTAVATVAAIERCGAVPILVEVDAECFTMDPNALEDAIHSLRTNTASAGVIPRAIIPVHLYGHPADMVAIMEIAKRNGLRVVEDCAQAHGASINGRKVGTWGEVAAFSLYPTKNLGALGDGGIVTTNDKELGKRVQLLRQYGWEERYISSFPGINSRLDPIQAAILRVKLAHLEDDNNIRRRHATRYNRVLANGRIQTPTVTAGCEHVYHQYIGRTQERDALQDYLRKKGIGSQVLYPMPIHQQPAYRDRIPQLQELPVTERLTDEIFTLPVYPELSTDEIAYVADSLASWLHS